MGVDALWLSPCMSRKAVLRPRYEKGAVVPVAWSKKAPICVCRSHKERLCGPPRLINVSPLISHQNVLCNSTNNGRVRLTKGSRPCFLAVPMDIHLQLAGKPSAIVPLLRI